MPQRSPVYPFNVVKGKLGAVSGKTQIASEFPMGPGYYGINVRMNVALTVGTASGPIAEGILNFLRQMSLRTSKGEKILDNVPARSLFKAAIEKYNVVPRYNEIAAATATYRVDIPIIFADPENQRPEDTVIDTSRYTSLTMDLFNGPLTDLFTSPGTASVVITYDIDIMRSKGRWPADAGLIGYPVFQLLSPIDAAQGTIIDLERATDLYYKRLYVHASTSGVAGQPFYGVNSDAIIDVMNLYDSDDNYVKDQTWAMVQDDNKVTQHLEAVPAGLVMLDLCRDGSNLSALYSGDKSMLRFSWTNQSPPGANSIVSVLAEGYRTFKTQAG